MNKDQYFNDLEEIITDKIFIGTSETDLHREIETNMWRISIPAELSEKVTVEDFNEFIYKIISQRKKQINDSSSNKGMYFYLWFDWMASQLRFNLISDTNEKLPFNCELQFVDDPIDIINDFINSPFHNGLPIEGIEDKSEEEEISLKIYKVHLRRQ